MGKWIYYIILWVVLLHYQNVWACTSTVKKDAFNRLIERTFEIEKESTPGNNIIVADFFILHGAEYVRMYRVPHYFPEDLKAYSITDKCVVLYYGVENTLAGEYLDLSTDISRLPAKDTTQRVHFEASLYFWAIKNDTIFEEFNPDVFFMNDVNNAIIGNGSEIPFPPPPRDIKKRKIAETGYGDNLTTRPQFSGGMAALYKFIKKNKAFYKEIRKYAYEDIAVIRFKISAEGKVLNAFAMECGVTPDNFERLHIEDVDIPDFIPGTIEGRNVEGYFTFYIVVE